MEEKRSEKILQLGEGLCKQIARLADMKALEVQQKGAIANSLNNIAEAINKFADTISKNK